MGLISGLLTLPLAPVRGTVWIAERILEQAEAEPDDEGAIVTQLMEIDAAARARRDQRAGSAEAEDILLERLIAIRTGDEGTMAESSATTKATAGRAVRPVT